MTTVSDHEWSEPRLYNGSRSIEPRTFTEADPISAVLVADYPDDSARAGDGAAPTWSSTTYVGRRRRRDRRRARPTAADGPPQLPADAPADEAPGTETAEPDLLDAVGAEPVGAGSEPELAAPAESARQEAGPVPDVEDTERSTRGLLANSGSMAVASLVSRVTGFLRTILIAVALGVFGVGNAYNSGNTFPNMVYELLLGGVLSSVLIPLLVHAQSEDDDGGQAYTQRLLSIAAAALGVMTILAVLAAPPLAAAFVDRGLAAGADEPVRHPAAAGDLLLRPGRHVHGRAEHPAQLQAGRLGPGREQRRHDRDDRGVLAAARSGHPQSGSITTPRSWYWGSGPRSASRRRRWCWCRRCARSASGGSGGSGRRPTRPVGCARWARSPAGSSPTWSSARSASRSSPRSVTTTAGSASSPKPICCSRCPTGSWWSRC